jgi:hypothetical protein
VPRTPFPPFAPPPPPPPPLRRIIAALDRANDTIAAHTHLPVRLVGFAEIASVLSFGVSLVGAKEYLAAIFVWLLLLLILLAKAVHRDGLQGRPPLTALLKVGHTAALIAAFALLTVWTEIKRGDEPWSVLSWSALTEILRSVSNIPPFWREPTTSRQPPPPPPRVVKPVPDTPTRNNVTVIVPATQPWTDTGLNVTRGLQITITATGRICAGSLVFAPCDSPDGQSRVSSDGYTCIGGSGMGGRFLAPGLACWSLIGMIVERGNEAGSIFEVGSSKTLRAKSSGELYLGVNDNYFGDNSGSWAANIFTSP